MDTPSLPDTLNETLSLAISDARLLGRADYHPHYRFWHGYSNHQCQVCLAGGIISRTLSVDPLTITSPGSFPPDTERKLRAVNCCRTGEFIDAYRLFHRCHAPIESQDLLDALPVPANFLFIGWEDFGKHLASLEAIVPRLREIEIEALSR